jgi:dolichol-phosphate mannosyltransferase
MSMLPDPVVKLSVIVPAFNEERTLGAVLRRIQQVAIPVDKEIIVVDDGSTDRTFEIAEEEARCCPFLRIVRMPRNSGKGSAIRCGATHASGDVLVVQDADLEVDPAEFPRLLLPVLNDGAKVVYGSRFLGRPVRWSLSGAANIFLAWFTNVLYGSRITDMETSHKVIARDVFNELILTGQRFDIEAEITAKLLRSGYRIHEVPIAYKPRGRGEGKKIGARDGVSAVMTLLRYRWAPLRSINRNRA